MNEGYFIPKTFKVSRKNGVYYFLDETSLNIFRFNNPHLTSKLYNGEKLDTVFLYDGDVFFVFVLPKVVNCNKIYVIDEDFSVRYKLKRKKVVSTNIIAHFEKVEILSIFESVKDENLVFIREDVKDLYILSGFLKQLNKVVAVFNCKTPRRTLVSNFVDYTSTNPVDSFFKRFFTIDKRFMWIKEVK